MNRRSAMLSLASLTVASVSTPAAERTESPDGVTAGSAAAKSVITEVTPESIKSVSGLSVQTEAEPGGMVKVTIRRVLPENTHLSGALSVADDRGPLAYVLVDALKFSDATEYRFSLRPDQARHSTFTLEERPLQKGENRPLVSCGPAFRFPLGMYFPAAKR